MKPRGPEVAQACESDSFSMRIGLICNLREDHPTS
jgi:hypothetical protein